MLRILDSGALGATAAGTTVSARAALILDGALNLGAEAVTLNGTSLPRRPDLTADGWTSRELGNGDSAVTIRHSRRGQVRIANEYLQSIP